MPTKGDNAAPLRLNMTAEERRLAHNASNRKSYRARQGKTDKSVKAELKAWLQETHYGILKRESDYLVQVSGLVDKQKTCKDKDDAIQSAMDIARDFYATVSLCYIQQFRRSLNVYKL
jgi:hypothetical protein